jgi:hypothetical protein
MTNTPARPTAPLKLLKTIKQPATHNATGLPGFAGVHSNAAIPRRSRGAKNQTTRVLEELLEGQAEQLLRTAIADAGSGDAACQKMLMDRYYPVRKGRPVPLDLPPIKSVPDVIAAMISVWNAIGQLTPDEIAAVTLVMDRSIKIIELLDVTNRVGALESIGSQLNEVGSSSSPGSP